MPFLAYFCWKKGENSDKTDFIVYFWKISTVFRAMCLWQLPFRRFGKFWNVKKMVRLFLEHQKELELDIWGQCTLDKMWQVKILNFRNFYFLNVFLILEVVKICENSWFFIKIHQKNTCFYFPSTKKHRKK